MVTGARIGVQLAADLLGDPNLSEPAIWLRNTAGHRISGGEFQAGAAIETPVSVVQAPITGQARNIVPEGLRDEDLRTFWVMGDIPSLRYGLADGDRFVMGALGANQNRFTGATIGDAESARDLYAIANPTWFASYQSNPAANAIQLRGFGSHPIYQRYDAINSHWINADVYRAADAKRWGAFTEVLSVRIDPGNL